MSESPAQPAPRAEPLRWVATAALLAAVTPWLGIVVAVVRVGFMEAEMLGALAACISSPAAILAVLSVVLYLVPLMLGVKLVFVAGHLFTNAGRSVLGGKPDASALRLCALVNIAAAVVCFAGWWIPGHINTILGASALVAAALSGIAARMIGRSPLASKP